jgi:organic hydroperoxide reductase OsmC/OhrA
VSGKPVLQGSADSAFRGDAARYNPEDLLVASLSACHMLWFLHLCAVAGVVVEDYGDNAEGVMVEDDSGGGRFERVVLRPRVKLKEPVDEARGMECHHGAHERCFIANSVSFPVDVEPQLVS